jgi:anti-sigma-K factor RskA
MEEHPQFAEDIELYALGVLEGEEKQALEEHLAACDDCHARLEDARGLVAIGSLTAPPLEVPAGSRERLLESVRARRMPAQEPASERPSFWLWPNLGWAFALAVVLLGASLVAIDNRRLSREAAALRAKFVQQNMQLAKTQVALYILRAPETQRVHLVSGDAKPVSEGWAFYHSHGLLFFASHLRPLEPDKTYELWLVPTEGKPMNCGTFQTDERWEGSVLLPPMPHMPPKVAAKAFAVTVEPAGGMPWPTGPQVLVGGL